MPQFECEITYEAVRHSREHSTSARQAEENVKRRKTAGGPPTVSLYADEDSVSVHCRPYH